MNSAKPALLFDYGGVIAEEGFREGLYVIADRNGLYRQHFYKTAQDAVYTTGFCLGTGTETDFWGYMRAHYTVAGDDAELTGEVLDRFILRPHMLTLVRGCRGAGVFCALLSDQTVWLDTLDTRDHFYAEFDRLFISYRLGKGKRDPSIFRDVIQELGVAPAQVAFIDDNAGNVARAKACGLYGIVFKDEADCAARLQEFTGINLVPPPRN